MLASLYHAADGRAESRNRRADLGGQQGQPSAGCPPSYRLDGQANHLRLPPHPSKIVPSCWRWTPAGQLRRREVMRTSSPARVGRKFTTASSASFVSTLSRISGALIQLGHRGARRRSLHRLLLSLGGSQVRPLVIRGRPDPSSGHWPSCSGSGSLSPERELRDLQRSGRPGRATLHRKRLR